MGLKPLPAKAADSSFVVTDIENRPDGSVIAIDTCWRNEDDETTHHFTCDSWLAYWDWLFPLAIKYEKWRTIYAHNGGGWDWLSLVEFLLSESGKGKARNLTAVCAGSKMVMLRVTIEHKCTITFCDSLQLLRSSLDKLARSVLGKSKVEMPYENHLEMFNADPVLFATYHRGDTELLLEILEKCLEIVRSNVAEIDRFGYTIGSTAMKVFRTIGMENEILIPQDPELKDLLREGYKGGRVEVFNSGYFDAVRVYDINSLYPAVMVSNHVPISDRGEWVEKFMPNSVGVYRIAFRQHRTSIPPVLLVRGKGEYAGEGVYFSPEIELLKSVDPTAEIEVLTGFVFYDTEILFRDYVEKLYALRLADSHGALSLMCKFLLNSLYGKFGQKAEREQIVKVDDWSELCNMVDGGAVVTPLNIDAGIYGLKHATFCGHEHVGIAGIITSAARVALYRGILSAWPNVAYCDTDSVHTIGCDLDSSKISSKLGDFKLEFSGAGVYAGKKLYALRDEKGTEKIRAKGVSIGGRNGAAIGFDDLRLIAEGKVTGILCEFQQPATPKQVFSGRNSCRFEPRRRTLRNTVNGRNG